MVAECVKRNGQRYTRRSTSHHNLDHQTDTRNDLKWSSADNSAHIDDIDDVRVLSVELKEFVGSVGREGTQTDNGDDTGDDTENLETTGERQNTKADLVSDEDEDGIPFAQGSVTLATLIEDVLDRLIRMLLLGCQDIIANVVDSVDLVAVDAADGRRAIMPMLLAHLGLRLCRLVLDAHGILEGVSE